VFLGDPLSDYADKRRRLLLLLLAQLLFIWNLNGGGLSDTENPVVQELAALLALLQLLLKISLASFCLL